MQKKRILDDQGYMGECTPSNAKKGNQLTTAVTIQEAGWESFSEDEAPPPAKKQTPSSTPASSGAKAKKPAGKGGQQGNIMSFFGKK
jgi:DNA polymerase delta subunit 3